MKLSENFSLAEMTTTSEPFPNAPGPVQTANLAALCENVLEPIRAHFGKPVHVNSAYRSAKVNAAVGSKPTSQHMLGQAADIEIPGVANGDLAVWIRDHLAFDQLILESYHPGQPSSGWVHVSYSGASKKGGSKGVNSVLTMAMMSHGPVYSAGIHA